MFDFDYPKVKQSLGKAALRETYPAWLLDPRGIIIAANVMAFWLWGMLDENGTYTPESLLGTNAFTLLTKMFERIPVDENVELYTKKSAVVKRLAARIDESLYTNFIESMKADPRRASIYERAVPNTANEWHYPLKMTQPKQNGSVAEPLLEFHVDNFRLIGGAGFLITCTPKGDTPTLIEAQYNHVINRYGEANYVHFLTDSDDRGRKVSRQPLTGFTSFGRVYYPTIVQDSLWYIVQENRAHRLLVGDSVVGVHFFELFFAPQLKEWMGPIQETSAPRAMKYFDAFTTQFTPDDAELHEEFVLVMQRLLNLQDFTRVLKIARTMPIRITYPEHDAAIFYTCRVILPWRCNPQVALYFRSMVQFIQPGLLGYSDGRNYRVILVPENYETEVGLILLYLTDTAVTAVTAENETEELTTQQLLTQFLWILTTTKTVQQGLALRDIPNTAWEPEEAWQNIHGELGTRFNEATEHTIAQVKAEFQAIMTGLDAEGLVDKGVLLTMLHSIARSQQNLEQLTVYIAKEIDGLN